MGKVNPKLKSVREGRKAERVRKLQLVIERKAAGRKQFEIAKELGVTEGRVSQLLKEAREIARERAAQSADQFLQEEIEHLDVLRRDLFHAWQRSQQDGEQIEKTKNMSGKLVISKHTSKGQAGDASLAAQLLKVHERLCKLKGLDVERIGVELGLRWAGQSSEEIDQQMMDRLGQLVQERRARVTSGVTSIQPGGNGNGNGKASE